MESRAHLSWLYPPCYNSLSGFMAIASARKETGHACSTTTPRRPQKLTPTAPRLHPVWQHLTPAQRHQLHLLLSQLLTRRLPPPPTAKEVGHEKP
jgi:hypothetical protein